MNCKTILLYLFSLPLLPGLNNYLKAGVTLDSSLTPSKRVTIFIHGTCMFRFFPLNFSTRLRDFDAQLSTPQSGLHHYSTIEKSNNQVKIVENLNQADPIMFPVDTFYFYGWSGKLNLNERRKAAKKLAHEIQTIIIKPYKERYGIEPEITIITHSHGGNVALNMAREKNLPFTIDSLIMLACPVQHETTKFINSSLFKTIYSLYSLNDTLQILDPQLLSTISHGFIKAFTKKSTRPLKKLWQKLKWPFFSSRHFYETPSLYQINVAWKDRIRWSELDFNTYGPLRSLVKKITMLDAHRNRGFYHTEFLIPTFVRTIPTIIKEAELLKKDFTFYL